MSAADVPDRDGEDGGGDSLAGEYVLGLLVGEDLLTARGRLGNDAAFADAVAAWEARLAPLFDMIAPAVPPARVWEAIAQALLDQAANGQAGSGTRDGDARGTGGEVVRLRRQVRRWQLGTGIAAALAGVLAIVGLQPDRPVPGPSAPPPPPIAIAAPAPLVAALAPKGGGTISLVYYPQGHRLAALAGDLKPRSGRDYQLWVIPDGGQPLALGLVAPGDNRTLTLGAAITAKLVPGSTVAVSLEPVGGSPTGLPTGPVLATGKISET